MIFFLFIYVDLLTKSMFLFKIYVNITQKKGVNFNMENNKITINLNTVIIIAVIIGALILGLISYFIYDNMNKEENNSIIAENDNNKQSESILDDADDNDNDEDSDITDNNSQIIDNSQKPSNTTKDKETTNSSTPNQTTTNSATGKPSSKQSPLAIGEWGISSRYLSGEYVDVPAKVTNVTRGSSAAQEVKQYLTSGSSIYKYEDAKEGMEWAVIEYSIDLTQVEKETTAKLDTKVTGTGDNTSIKYNGTTYIVSTVNMTPNNYTKGSIETCKFAVQLPIGCTDYLIVLGSSSGSQAFFTGK